MASLFTFLIGKLSGLTGYLILAGLLLTLSFYLGYRWELSSYNSLRSSVNASTAKAIQTAKDKQESADQITLQQAVTAAESKQKIITNTKIITKDVPVYITKKEDTSHCITIGDVVLLNAAIYQVDPESIPISSNKSSESCSEIKASDFIKSIISNYGSAQQAIEESNNWRRWYKAQAKVWNAH